MYRSRFGTRPFPEVPGFNSSAEFNFSRRRFVQGLAGGALVLAAGVAGAGGAANGRGTGGAAGAAGETVAGGERGSILRGTDFQLEIGARQMNFTGA